MEEFKRQLKSLTLKLKEAENRAEFAEKTVKKLQKEVDRLEGMFLACFQFFLLLLLLLFTSFPLNQNKKRENLLKMTEEKNLRKITVSVSQHLLLTSSNSQIDDYFYANLYFTS